MYIVAYKIFMYLKFLAKMLIICQTFLQGLFQKIDNHMIIGVNSTLQSRFIKKESRYAPFNLFQSLIYFKL